MAKQPVKKKRGGGGGRRVMRVHGVFGVFRFRVAVWPFWIRLFLTSDDCDSLDEC